MCSTNNKSVQKIPLPWYCEELPAIVPLRPGVIPACIMKKLHALALLALLSTPARAQTSASLSSKNDKENSSPREVNKGEILATISGVGIDRYHPPLNDAAEATGPWTNVNLLLYVLELQAGWGTAEADVSKLPLDRFGGTSVGTPGIPVYGRNWAVGVNLPVGVRSIGINSGRPGSLLRAHPFVAFNIGGMSLWDGDKQNKSSFACAGLAPGFRVFNNFLSAEVRLQIQIGLGTGEYNEYISKASLQPVFTLRANGLFKSLVTGSKLVGSTSYSVSDVRSTSKTDYVDKPDGRYERTMTTTTANVSSRRGSSLLTNMGTYFGVGPRVSFTRPFAEHYAEPSIMLGLGAQLRRSKLLLGANVEHGRAGHASITRVRGEDKRKISKDETYAKGRYTMTNAFADVGLDISSLVKGLALFTADEENNATTFASVNVGYSLGVGVVTGQQFSDDSLAISTLRGYEVGRTDWVASKRTDPREGGTGIMGGFFLGFDLGNVGFRAQWYRYKAAPLANNLYYTLTYRFGSSKKK